MHIVEVGTTKPLALPESSPAVSSRRCPFSPVLSLTDTWVLTVSACMGGRPAMGRAGRAGRTDLAGRVGYRAAQGHRAGPVAG
jgi:hypothetical protein